MDIALLGQKFRISTDENDQYLSALVSHYRSLVETVKHTTTPSNSHITAILAGLLAVDEYYKLRDAPPPHAPSGAQSHAPSGAQSHAPSGAQSHAPSGAQSHAPSAAQPSATAPPAPLTPRPAPPKPDEATTIANSILSKIDEII